MLELSWKGWQTQRERERDTYTKVNLSCRSKPQQMMLIMLLLMPVVNEGEFVCQALHFFCVIVISHTVGNLNHIGSLTLKPGSSQLLSKAVAQSCQGDFSLQRFFCNMPRARGTAISLLGCSFVVWTCPMQAATPSEWQVHHWHFYKYSCEKWWK